MDEQAHSRPQTAEDLIYAFARHTGNSAEQAALWAFNTYFNSGRFVYGVDITESYMDVTVEAARIGEFLAAFPGFRQGDKTFPGLVIVRLPISDK